MFVWIKVQNQYSYTLPVCIILDTEFSNVTVNNNNSNKRPISSLKSRTNAQISRTLSPEAALSFHSILFTPVLLAGRGRGSAPAERDVAGPVTSLLYQWFVELPPSTGVYAGPAVFTVILQAGNVGTKERSKFPTTASALAFVTHLIIQHVWLHFHLHQGQENNCENVSSFC